ncbi:hypothetical protein BV898_17179 [Hypsibius exemplaris]|uniref:CUB domain-containing protein n=1 Tax=Hypsibius exemplaris TaxID=2072580 RepID=A0A9X6NN73_HYPEX|nr:hypothetical protein BV898_17179 [Hypsibius exemplaris]
MWGAPEGPSGSGGAPEGSIGSGGAPEGPSGSGGAPEGSIGMWGAPEGPSGCGAPLRLHRDVDPQGPLRVPPSVNPNVPLMVLSVNSQGFELTFSETDDAPPPRPTQPPTPTPCGGTVVQTGDTPAYIESPNFPSNYDESKTCTWTVTSDVGTLLEFTAEAFNTEAGYDHLRFSDIPAVGEPLGTFSGTVGPLELRSVGNAALVVFSSDGSNTDTGFRIRINRFIPKCPAPLGICPNTGDEEICFAAGQLCDGNEDCPGGVDEVCPPGCGIPTIKPFLSTRSGDRIVGGIEVAHKSLLAVGRWSVTLIEFVFGANGMAFLTFSASIRPSLYKVRVGEHDIEGDSEENAWTYDLELVIPHPRYGMDGARSNDICLLKTRLPIFFNEHVFPVCVGSETTAPVGTDCFTTGWGSQLQVPAKSEDFKECDDTREKESVRAGDLLQQVDVKLAEQAVCEAIYANHTQPAVISEDMLCGYNFGKDRYQ